MALSRARGIHQVLAVACLALATLASGCVNGPLSCKQIRAVDPGPEVPVVSWLLGAPKEVAERLQGPFRYRLTSDGSDTPEDGLDKTTWQVVSTDSLGSFTGSLVIASQSGRFVSLELRVGPSLKSWNETKDLLAWGLDQAGDDATQYRWFPASEAEPRTVRIAPVFAGQPLDHYATLGPSWRGDDVFSLYIQDIPAHVKPSVSPQELDRRANTLGECTGHRDGHVASGTFQYERHVATTDPDVTGPRLVWQTSYAWGDCSAPGNGVTYDFDAVSGALLSESPLGSCGG